jgi:two-component system sensor histidine kinase CreC
VKIGVRIFLGVLVVLALGLFLVVRWIGSDLEPQYRKATEEPLVDASRILASVAAGNARGGRIDVAAFRVAFADAKSRRFSAAIFDHLKTEIDFRVYITDEAGIVRFHSHDPSRQGQDFSKWIDVARTLKGEYGARTTLEDPSDPASKFMYVAAPIVVGGKTVGVLSVGKPTRTTKSFAARARRKMVVAGLAVFSAMILAVMLLSGMISRPIRMLTDYARAVRDGKRTELPRLGGGEVAELGAAFEEMRDALEGRRYVERYVQALTHEIKGPLSAVGGAVELLREEMEPAQRERFLENVRTESARIQTIIEKLLLLSSLESRKGLGATGRFDLRGVVDEAAQELRPALERKRIRLSVEGERRCPLDGDAFLLRHAVANLLQNAVDFSHDGGEVSVSLTSTADGYAKLSVRDWGAGIPEYAVEKVFDRFYSLKRPDTGKKSSGLGLSLVREIALLHRGTVTLINAPGGGTEAVLRLPRRTGRSS